MTGSGFSNPTGVKPLGCSSMDSVAAAVGEEETWDAPLPSPAYELFGESGEPDENGWWATNGVEHTWCTSGIRGLVNVRKDGRLREVAIRCATLHQGRLYFRIVEVDASGTGLVDESSSASELEESETEDDGPKRQRRSVMSSQVEEEMSESGDDDEDDESGESDDCDFDRIPLVLDERECEQAVALLILARVYGSWHSRKEIRRKLEPLPGEGTEPTPFWSLPQHFEAKQKLPTGLSLSDVPPDSIAAYQFVLIRPGTSDDALEDFGKGKPTRKKLWFGGIVREGVFSDHDLTVAGLMAKDGDRPALTKLSRLVSPVPCQLEPCGVGGCLWTIEG